MDFKTKLKKKWDKGKFVCIGLDPVVDKLPSIVNGNLFKFNKAIIDKTHDLVLSYKPNSAFYEAEGPKGIEQLKQTVEYIQNNYPDVPIILDAKRGDIGSTNEGYVKFIFDYLKVDAVTLHPYLGEEALRPFLDRKDKGVIVLCKTSNEGSGEFQDIDDLYLKVAKNVSKKWNRNGNCALVVGATYPEELNRVREVAPEIPILIPGIGAQGGDLEGTIKNGLDSNNQGMIISSSRGIIFASNGDDFAEKARSETEKLNKQIKKVLL